MPSSKTSSPSFRRERITPSKPESKLEIRILKSEKNRKTNKSQIQKIQTTESESECFEFCIFFQSFEFVSNFGFRASNFFLCVLCVSHGLFNVLVHSEFQIRLARIILPPIF